MFHWGTENFAFSKRYTEYLNLYGQSYCGSSVNEIKSALDWFKCVTVLEVHKKYGDNNCAFS